MGLGCLAIPSERLFTRACSDRTRGSGFKTTVGLDQILGKILHCEVVMSWHRLPREVVYALSLEVFKSRLDGALSNLV